MIDPHFHRSAGNVDETAQGYADSLRQQADWIEESREGRVPIHQRIDLGDIDLDELRAAADFIERMRSEPQTVEVTAPRLAAIIHDGRFPDGRDAPNYVPFEQEGTSGREYCLRIAKLILSSCSVTRPERATASAPDASVPAQRPRE